MNNVSNRVSERIKLLIFSSLTIATSAAYLGSIFLLGQSFLGFQFHATHEALLTLGLVALAIWLCLVLSKYAPNYVSVAMNVQVSILITLLLMIAVDISYAVIQNAMRPKSSVYGYEREYDSNFVIGEFYPKTYFPTDKNFHLQKPNMAVTASSFGNFYSSDMLDSPTLVNSTLERHTVSITINELGFRETESIENARIFALGDSFTFGWGVNVDKSWVKQLESRLSAPIYNLGSDDASPKQELELLKFLLNTSEHHIKIQHLLWMIYEGNDLEDSYDEMAPRHKPQPIALFSGTVLETLATLPHVIQEESVIRKMLSGAIQFRYATKGVDSSHEFVDGIALAHPLFKSDRFGYKLFYGPYVDLVQEPMSYVLLHPNRPKLEKVFTEMGELARNFRFDVTVILAPIEGRLQGKYFAGFPKASDRPYFLDFVAGLARKEKFQIINLYDTLRPLADRRLLYFRDDDHWNEDGNLLVATSLSEQLSEWKCPEFFSEHRPALA